ncbi:protein fixA [Bradyrhizobium sp. CCBAU 45321]|uniref:Protein FixA n=2 Tax=Bradyrhizobium yuanmingense TaxID=108015 RepID=A0A1C3XG03_9BRAD|nr:MULTISPECIES: electron transfer flavoprotein subunit beta/FixA family protein [Bradyrhizobium]MCA1544418.1 electron transfer flavoprotein subunit beta/FixA family protein [Bradyrhizobium sp. NBAIM32]MDA9545363.1 protein fixA [Bradyrhizobium sp. CCBAU 45321]TWI19511.1 electron transfer flavoprotein beta subunit [Bradyrhizobium yuanmingense]SCB50904.1 electron transfer flavoprotein beta subunit [Bradyrhizobium yuanmingense]
MHNVVCIKQVPDSAQIRVHPVTNTIMRQGVPTIINPYDLFALEAALELRDRFGGEITVLTMGPPSADESLRRALAYGADRAVLLTDRCFAGSDTLATTYALATAIRKIGKDYGPTNLIFTGKQTIDGDTAQVGPGIAKRMGVGQLTYVAKIRSLDLAAQTIEVERRCEGGVQVLQTKLPCLITMLEATNQIRRGAMADALRAARAQIVKWSAHEAGVEDTSNCGLKGSPTVVKRVFAPSARAEKASLVEAAEQPAQALIDAIFSLQPKLETDLAALAREARSGESRP